MMPSGDMAEIGREFIFINQYNMGLAALGEAVENEDTAVAEARQEFKGNLVRAEKPITKHRSSATIEHKVAEFPR
jgi:hypothetical protein